MEQVTREKLINALAEMDEANNEHYTDGGKPRIDMLEELSGVNGVTATMRDDAFAAFKVEQGSKDDDENNSQPTPDAAPAAKRQMYNVTIHDVEGESGDAFLSVNGKTILVKRNEEVQLSEAYVEVLRNSKVESFVQDPDTGKKRKLSIQRFPHSAHPV